MKVPPFLLILLVGSTPILLVALILSASSVELVAWRPPIAWSEEYGTLEGEIDNSVNAVAAGGSGVFAAGYVNTPVSGNATSGSLFVRSYDLAGNMGWTHDQQSVYFDQFSGISVGNDGVYIVGNLNNSVAVLKFDLNGTRLWTRQIGSFNSNNRGIGIFSTSTGEYVTGTIYPPITNQTFTGIVMFVREYDPSGNVIWTSEFSNSTNTFLKGIYANSSGVYILADGLQIGGFLVRYDLNGNVLWNISGGGIGISGDESAVYVARLSQFNRFTLPPLGVLTKYNSDGNAIWTVQFDVADHSGVEHPQVSADSSGVYLAVRSIFGHVYLFKFDSQGSQVWSFQPPLFRTSTTFSSSIAVSPGRLYVGGSLRTASAHSLAFLEDIAKDGSLIFLGLQPPWSIVLIVGTGAFVTINIFLHLRRRRQLRRSGVEPLNRIPLGVPKD